MQSFHCFCTESSPRFKRLPNLKEVEDQLKDCRNMIQKEGQEKSRICGKQ